MAFSPETYALLKAQGGGNGGNPSELFFYVEQENDVLNKTWAEIKAAYDDGKQVFFRGTFIEEENVLENRYNYLLINIVMDAEENVFAVSFYSGGAIPATYETNSADGYPVFVDV